MSFEIDWDNWRAKTMPFGFSGCFRLRNESQFMEYAIESHLPWLDEAVLIVQPSDDDTIEKAHRMADENAKINVYEYPFECDWIDTPEFYAKDPHAPGHMVHMSNWAFTKCRYSWIVKVEGDVIATSAFADVIDRVLFEPDIDRYYGRVVLNVAGADCDQISWDNPRNGGWDEAVVPNHPDYHFERQDKWEVLQNPGEGICMGWSGLHMKRCKEGKTFRWNGEKYVPFEPEQVILTLSRFNKAMAYPATDDPLGAETVYEKEWIERYLSAR
jgi:hypothetical protein